MAKRRLKFTYPHGLITEPIIGRVCKNYEVMVNIRRANVTEEEGWVVLELEGELEEIDRAVAWVVAQGVRVDPVEGDVVAG
ncbi:MAG: NIL domain-containing protein [Chloroflexi bacterium]|nr:NIL domain-containing protein [Chloroflexota bacterium]